MKRFTMFLIILITAAFIGVSSYYFAVDAEEIKLNNSLVQVNAGSTFTPELEIIKKNKKTKITYSIEDPTIVKEGENGSFIALKGGSTNINVATSNKKYPYFQIQVKVGEGTKQNPYFIFNGLDLRSIGSSERNWKLTDSYILANSIDLSNYECFEPIGTEEKPFRGNFDGNLCNITGLKINNQIQNIKVAGLFGYTSDSSSIEFVKIINPTIVGNFDYIGTIAAVNSGKIGKSLVEGGSISTTNTNCITGGIVGYNIIDINKPNIEICDSFINIKGYGNIGGIVGRNEGGIIFNCNARGNILKQDTRNTFVSGIVAVNSFGEVKQGYTNVQNERFRQGNVKNCLFNGTISCDTGCNLDSTGYVIGTNLEKDFNKNEIIGNYYTASFVKTENGEEEIILPAIAFINYTDIQVKKLDKETVLKEESYKTINDYFDYINKSSSEEVELDSWDFVNIWLLEENKAPVLNLEGDYSNSNIYEYASQKISNADDFYNLMQSIKDDKVKLSLTYYLEGDIKLTDKQLWLPVGSIDYPFTGKIIGVYKRYNNELRYPIISNVVIPYSNQYAGIVGYLQDSGSITGITLNNVKIQNSTYSGAFAGVNEGLISDCSVNGININGGNFVGALAGLNLGTIARCKIDFNSTDVDPSLSEEELEKSIAMIISRDNGNAIGGVTGINKGNILNCTSSSYILDKTEEGLTNHIIYAGGVAGINYSNISDCKIPQGIIKLKNTKSVSGGLAGENYGIIEKSNCNFSIECFSAENSTESIVGGLVGNNYNEIKLSYSKNVLEGCFVGGLIGKNFGNMNECFARNVFEANTGREVGGFVYDNISGQIKNCYSYIKLSGVDENSTLAGFSVYIRRDAKFNSCFSNVSFTGAGTKWEETSSMIRRSKTEKFIATIVKEDADVGVIKDCVFNSTNTEESKAYYRRGWITNNSADDTNYLPLSDVLCKGGENISYYTFLSDGRFDVSIWNFTYVGSYPILFNIDINAQIEDKTEIV